MMVVELSRFFGVDRDMKPDDTEISSRKSEDMSEL
jgi:hypothetical protein